MRKLLLVLSLAFTLFSASAFADKVTPTAAVTSSVVVHASASASGAKVGSLLPGQQADLLGSMTGWYHVQLTNGTDGYVSKRYTQIIPDAPVPPAPGPAPAPAPSATTFTVDVVDVGTGLGILVRGPDFTLVYDGGSNDDTVRGPGNRMLAYIKAVAPTLTTIDHLILSHPHRDHVELLPDLFAAYQVKQVWDSGRVNDICGYRMFIAAIQAQPAIQYHDALSGSGTGDFSFAAGDCYGDKLPAVVMHIPLASRIDQVPVPLGQGASMTFLHADGTPHTDVNMNSLVVRLDLGEARVLFAGDEEAGPRQDPSVAPSKTSVEANLLSCCASELASNLLVVGHHGSMTSSRKAFLDQVGASIYVVSSGPNKYDSVVLPDAAVIAELTSRGQLFRTDLNDATCGSNPAKIGPDNDGQPGGCDNIRITISSSGSLSPAYLHIHD